jgi:hypothetical protein
MTIFAGTELIDRHNDCSKFRRAHRLVQVYASALGQHLVNATVQFGVAKAMHEDLRYYPSEKPGFGPRVEHALVSTMYARKTNGT